MAVSKKHQRRGIGQELMKWGMKVADEMKAEVRDYFRKGWVDIKLTRVFKVCCRSQCQRTWAL